MFCFSLTPGRTITPAKTALRQLCQHACDSSGNGACDDRTLLDAASPHSYILSSSTAPIQPQCPFAEFKLGLPSRQRSGLGAEHGARISVRRCCRGTLSTLSEDFNPSLPQAGYDGTQVSRLRWMHVVSDQRVGSAGLLAAMARPSSGEEVKVLRPNRFPLFPLGALDIGHGGGTLLLGRLEAAGPGLRAGRVPAALIFGRPR